MKEQIWQEAYDKLKQEHKDMREALETIEKVDFCIRPAENGFIYKMDFNLVVESYKNIAKEALNKTSL